MKNKCLFLDRDGVINKEINYLYKIEDFIFVDGIFDLCSKYQKEHFKIIIITNQAGIARGYYTESDLKKLNQWLINQFKKKGIIISDIYYCPHHPDFSGNCKCRKPNPGLILNAAERHNIDLKNSVMIGDKKTDILAGKKAGIVKNILIKTNIIPSKLYA